jgi:hypothetical protein
MNPEQGLNQLGTALADMMRKQDILTFKQEQVYHQNRVLATMIFDSAVEQSQMKIRLDKIETDVAEINGKLDMILVLLCGQNGH